MAQSRSAASTASAVSEVSAGMQCEYLKIIPNFDGNVVELPRFISTCEQVIHVLAEDLSAEDPRNYLIFATIINKIQGRAKIIIDTHNPQNWAALKTVLTNNYSDHRDEACLLKELLLLRQAVNEGYPSFTNKIFELQNLLFAHAELKETNNLVKNTKKQMYEELVFKSFLAGLKEPMGSQIRSMRPSNLVEATKFLNEERSIRTLKYNHQPIQTQQRSPRRWQHFRQQEPTRDRWNPPSQPSRQWNRNTRSSTQVRSERQVEPMSTQTILPQQMYNVENFRESPQDNQFT